MNIKFLDNSDIHNFEVALESIAKDAKSILILACDENNYDLKHMNTILSNCKTPIIGGIFPQIVYQNRNYTTGTIIASIDDVLDIEIIEDLSKQDVDTFEESIEEKLGVLDADIKTMFVFVDGLSKHINQLILGLFENFGLTINYIGGGAGSLSFEQKPCLFSNQGILEDCALLATSKLASCIGVKHGWSAITEPFKVTQASANILLELNYKPAFDIYKEIVEKASNQSINEDNFFDIAKGYPLGINKLSGEMVVRDPIILKDNALVCVGDIALNSYVSVLHGDKDSLVSAVKEAREETELHHNNHFTFFIDCISRVLFMEDGFSEELDAAYDKGTILIGALTLGEIANNKKHYLEFYNKTAVIANIQSKYI